MTRQQPFAVTVLMFINFGCSAALIFAWPDLAPRLAAPFGWAFGKAIATKLSIWELPFMLMWIVPAGSAIAGWILDSFEQTNWALIVLVLPLATMAATMVMFKVLG